MYTLPPDPYLALAVPKDADDKAIKASYRKLILSCHPDKVQDPELKAQKQAEFQQVQQAYELLTSPDARKNYDRKARLNDEMSRMPASSPMNTRTPPRNPYPDVNIRTAEPRPSTFSKSGPSPSSSKFYSASNTSSRSWEDELGRSYGSKKSSSDKYQDYEPEEKPSKRDSGRHRRREEAEWERERARAAEAEEKKKSKEKKSHERSSEKKKADKERKRDGDSKHHSRSPYVETFTNDDEEEEDVIYGKPPRSDRKKSTSSRKHDDGIQEAARTAAAATDRERKNSDTMDFATRYLQRSGGKPPSLGRSKTYHEQAYFATPAVPTPPPAHSAVYPPPPQPRARDVMGEEDMGRRSSGKSASRRMSNDTSKSSRDKSAAPKKSSTRGASRDARPVILEGGSPLPRVVPVFAKSQTTSAAGLANMVSGQSPRTPGLHRASTDQYARPQATPSTERSRTWGNSGGDRRHKQQQWKMSDEEDDDEEEDEEETESSDDGEESTSEEEPVPPPRRSRRARSPEPMPMPTQASRTQTTYKVAGGKTASRQTYATAEPAMSKKDRVKATYAPPKNKANTGVARSMEYESYDYEAAAANAWQYQQQHAQMAPGYASGIQYSPMFDEGDIAYSKVRHAAAH